MNTGNNINTTRSPRRKELTMNRVSRLATTAVVSGAVAVAGLALSAGTSQADPNQAVGYNWCPDQKYPPFPQIRWDMAVCHTYYVVPAGTGNVTMVDLQGNPIDSFVSADIPAPVFAPPPPPPPQAPHPFCTPRGAFIIIPPICDEIGVDLPPGSVNH
jgi:hypothetical protein